MQETPEPGRVWYWTVLVLHVALLWALPFIPSEDGPSHLYNTLIVRDLLHGGQTYGPFYNLHLTVAPNLGALLPLYALTALLPPLAAEKAFLTVVMLLLAGVMPRLARMVGGRPYPGSFLLFPLLYSAIVLYGFYSFLLGQALFLWAIWLYWRLRAVRAWPRWLVATASAIVLAVCHLLPFACYLLAVGVASILPTPAAAPLGARVRSAVLQLTAPGAVLIAFAWSLSRATPSVAYATPPAVVSVWSGLDGTANLVAALFLFAQGQPALDLTQLWTGIALGAVLTWLLMRPGTRLSCRWTDGGSATDDDAVAARRVLVVVAGVLVAATFLVPDAVGELALIKVRFPCIVCLLLVPLASCVTPLPVLRRILVTVSLIGAAANGWYVVQYARQVQTLVTAGPESGARGRYVAGYVGQRSAGFAKVMLHATSYYCAVEECVDLGNYQAFLGHFFVSFKPDPTLAVSRSLDTSGTTVPWERYPGVAYLRGWAFDAAERARVGRTFDLVNESGSATVWRRKDRGILQP